MSLKVVTMIDNVIQLLAIWHAYCCKSIIINVSVCFFFIYANKITLRTNLSFWNLTLSGISRQ